MRDLLLEIANKFSNSILEINEYGSGNINDTYIVTQKADEKKNFILQKINLNVFKNPKLIMHNISILNRHVKNNFPNLKDFVVPEIIPTISNENYYVHPDKSFWRALTFVKNSISFDKIKDFSHAHEVGLVLGTFHACTNTLNPKELYDTLAGFHITPQYFTKYETILKNTQTNSSPEIDYCKRFIIKNKDFANTLEAAKEKKILKIKTIHGDPKISNILIDSASRKGISIVDLDTIKPGLIHYDIGDALRSCCNIAGEETQNLNEVAFSLDLCKEILRGYFQNTRTFLTKDDHDFIFTSVKLISFELGLRFFTDFLQGNIYFKTKSINHNLIRALVQFKLCNDIEKKKSKIIQLINEIGRLG